MYNRFDRTMILFAKVYLVICMTISFPRPNLHNTPGPDILVKNMDPYILQACMSPCIDYYIEFGKWRNQVVFEASNAFTSGC